MYFKSDWRKNNKSSNPDKPSDSELEHYKESHLIRKASLRKASGVEATSNFLGGEGYKNLELYANFYNDLITYHYAWFEIIFKNKNKNDLLSACNTIIKFATVKLENVAEDLDEIVHIVELLYKMKEMFQDGIASHDVEACENAGMLEYDYYELCYKLSVEMTIAKRKDEAEKYFSDAYSSETCWGYYERHCAKVLQYATGKSFSVDFDEDELSHTGFYHNCLDAFVYRRKGSIPYNYSKGSRKVKKRTA